MTTNIIKNELEVRKEILDFIKKYHFKHTDKLEAMIYTLFKLFYEQNHDLDDLKLIETTPQELRKTFKVFYPYNDIRKVCLFVSARTPEDDPNFELAELFSNNSGHSVSFLIIKVFFFK